MASLTRQARCRRPVRWGVGRWVLRAVGAEGLVSVHVDAFSCSNGTPPIPLPPRHRCRHHLRRRRRRRHSGVHLPLCCRGTLLENVERISLYNCIHCYHTRNRARSAAAGPLVTPSAHHWHTTVWSILTPMVLWLLWPHISKSRMILWYRIRVCRHRPHHALGANAATG